MLRQTAPRMRESTEENPYFLLHEKKGEGKKKSCFHSSVPSFLGSTVAADSTLMKMTDEQEQKRGKKTRERKVLPS